MKKLQMRKEAFNKTVRKALTMYEKLMANGWTKEEAFLMAKKNARLNAIEIVLFSAYID